MSSQLSQQGMIGFTAWTYGTRFPACYTMVDCQADITDRVRWILVRPHGDPDGLWNALSMAYAGLATVLTIEQLPANSSRPDCYEVTLKYADE